MRERERYLIDCSNGSRHKLCTMFHGTTVNIFPSFFFWSFLRRGKPGSTCFWPKKKQKTTLTSYLDASPLNPCDMRWALGLVATFSLFTASLSPQYLPASILMLFVTFSEFGLKRFSSFSASRFLMTQKKYKTQKYHLFYKLFVLQWTASFRLGLQELKSYGPITSEERMQSASPMFATSSRSRTSKKKSMNV